MVALVVTMVVTALIYNSDSAFERTLHIPRKVYVYTCMWVIFFLLYRFLSGKFLLPAGLTLLLTVIPPILLDSTTLISGPALVPLRFPFGTLFPVLGAVGGFIYSSVSRVHFALFCLGVTGFIYLSVHVIVPRIALYQMEGKDKAVWIKPDAAFFDKTFYTPDGIPVVLKSVMHDPFTLLEFYYVGCGACHQKHKALKNITSPNIKVILICDGTITSFESFNKHLAGTEPSDNMIFLYDRDAVTASHLGIQLFPHELLYKHRVLVRNVVGFNLPAKDLYLNELNEMIRLK